MEFEKRLQGVRERFRDAEKQGWFFPGEPFVSFPIDISGQPHKGKERHKRAAVLFLIGCRAGSSQLHVLITKRSTQVGSHIGECCLPGGMQDSRDKSSLDTAIREAEEEIGIDSQKIEVVCSLPPFVSGWLQTIAVTPVIGLLHMDIDQLQIHANHEVECAFWVPLSHFISSDNHRTLRGNWRSQLISVESFHYDEPVTGHCHNIWGLTSSICVTVSSLALGEPPHFAYTHRVIWKMDQQYVYLKELAPLSLLCGHVHAERTCVQNSKL